MNALPRTAKVSAQSALFGAGQWGGGSALASRRKICAPPLSRPRRALQESALHRTARECEGIAVVDYYGHPSRGMAIAYPLPGETIETTRQAIRDAAVPQIINYSCGNVIFSLF